MAYTVAVYLVDRAFGGSEEGGWWFEYGEPSDEYAHYTRGFTDIELARSYMTDLNRLSAPIWNKGRREIDSVLSDGRYYAEVHEGQPKPYPAQRPRYE